MTQSSASFDPLLVTIVLGTLAVGLPILTVLAIRFLWDRNLNVGPSKQLEKLIWQLHRIASALEHQMNLSFPAVQPGTEEAHDLAYFQRITAQPNAATQAAAAPSTATVPTVAEPPARPVIVQQPVTPQPVTPQPVAQKPSVAPPAPQEVTDDVPRRAGVNSMFGL